MVYRNIRQVARDWQWIAALLCIVLMLAPPGAWAGIQEIRVVAVGIDSSSVAAEEKAINYARKRAVYLASRKLGIKNVSKVVAKFSEKQFGEIIRGANVVQSRRQGEVTYSEVNVSIVDEALRRALKLPNAPAVAPADVKVRGVLLVPIYVGRERAFLWEKENQLRQPLWDEVRRQSKAGILLPGGDFDDLRLIDYQNALTVKTEELRPMFERYGAEEIIIAVMTPSAPGTTDASSVLLRRLNISGEERHEVIEVPPESIEEASAIRLTKTASAIAGAVTQIASSTAEREQAVRAQAKQMKVRFSYAIPKDLAFMQEAVRKAPETLYLDIPSIALAQVTGTIYLKGDDEALRASLVKQGVIVTTINDGWRLSIR